MARENLKRARKAAGLTQKAMAENLHICLRHYQFIEAGTFTGNVELWDQMEDFFNIHQRVLRENSHDTKDNP